MFTLNEDMSIYATRGDEISFSVRASDYKEGLMFCAGDIVRMRIFGKKDCANVVLLKDFDITEDTVETTVHLTGTETKIGGIINKPADYWYEIELNPDTSPQTIIGYDENGPKIFRLFPEGKDITDGDLPNEETRSEVTRIINTAIEKLFNEAVENGELTGPQGIQGEPGKDAITDRTYSPESENAQSGVAVAEALTDKMDKFGEVTENGVEATKEEFEFKVARTLKIIGGDKLLLLSLSEGLAGIYDANDYPSLAPFEVFTPEADAPYAAANKKYVDEKNALQNNTFANALKGKAEGLGSVTIDDISPISHDVEIVKTEQTLVNVYSDTDLTVNSYITIMLNENVEPGASYVIDVTSSSQEETEFSLYSSNKLFKTNIPINGSTDFVVLPEDYTGSSLYIFTGNTTGGNGKTIVFDTIDIYRITATEKSTTSIEKSSYPEMTVTADNTFDKITVTYNRDICKAIENIENALGLVNTTLASVVEVE